MKSNREDFYPAAMTIAVSDSGGGTGIQADLRTFNAAGVFGCSVITAVTAQNPREITHVVPMAPEIIKAQFQAVVDALSVKAVKTGMLVNADNVKAVAGLLKKHKLPLVVDPAMIAGNGENLLDNDGMVAVKTHLLPLADMIVLNTAEAKWLTGKNLRTQDDYVQAAILLAGEFKCNVLLKNATEKGGKSADISVINQMAYTLAMPRVEDLSQYAEHGSGCTLASGITAMLAAGCDWPDALRAAKAHVYGALCETAHVGKDIDAMYPPLEDYSKLVSLSRIQTSKPTCKGSGA